MGLNRELNKDFTQALTYYSKALEEWKKL